MTKRDNKGRFKKGNIPWISGRHHTAESNKKNSEKHLGKPSVNKGIKGIHISPATEFKKGNIPKAPIKKGEHISPNTEFRIGQKSPKKGKTFEEIYGLERAALIKNKRIKKIKDKPTWNKGKTGIYSKETIDKIKEGKLRQVIPKKDTKIEKIIQNQLKDKGYIIETHKAVTGQPDSYIPELNLHIFGDGCYWHNCHECKFIQKELINHNSIVLENNGIKILM